MPTNILIVKLSSLGDVLHALPAAQAIRARYPGAYLGWAIERSHASLLRGQTWLDEVFEWNRESHQTFVDFTCSLRRTRWDVAIDLQGLFRSGIIARMSGARRRIGARQAREMAHMFYNEPVDMKTLNRHAVERSLELAGALDARFPGLPLDRPYLDGRPPAAMSLGPRLFPLHPTDQDRSAVDVWLHRSQIDPERERLVVLNPHCRREANVWPASKFIELAARLLKVPGVRVALVGGAVARSLCDQIASAVGPSLARADGRLSLLASADLFSRSSVVVTGDTGPMHLAAAVGAPIVALLGATAGELTGPYAADAVVLSKRIECSPCLAKRCPLRYDPPLCMDSISTTEVFEAVLARVNEADHRHRKSA